MISYFKTVNFPPSIALGITYTFAVFEIIIDLTFLVLFLWQLLPEKREDKQSMFTDRTLHRLAYKASVILFLILSVGYQLFGDRTRLWVVGTYMAMTLIVYDIWYRTDRFMLDISRKRLTGIEDDDGTYSDQTSAYNLKDKNKI